MFRGHPSSWSSKCFCGSGREGSTVVQRVLGQCDREFPTTFIPTTSFHTTFIPTTFIPTTFTTTTSIPTSFIPTTFAPTLLNNVMLKFYKY